LQCGFFLTAGFFCALFFSTGQFNFGNFGNILGNFANLGGGNNMQTAAAANGNGGGFGNLLGNLFGGLQNVGNAVRLCFVFCGFCFLFFFFFFFFVLFSVLWLICCTLFYFTI
jgi:hypothetical protein